MRKWLVNNTSVYFFSPPGLLEHDFMKKTAREKRWSARVSRLECTRCPRPVDRGRPQCPVSYPDNNSASHLFASSTLLVAVRDHVSKHVRDLSPGATSSFGFAALCCALAWRETESPKPRVRLSTFLQTKKSVRFPSPCAQIEKVRVTPNRKTWFTYQDNVENRGRASEATSVRFLRQENVLQNLPNVCDNLLQLANARTVTLHPHYFLTLHPHSCLYISESFFFPLSHSYWLWHWRWRSPSKRLITVLVTTFTTVPFLSAIKKRPILSIKSFVWSRVKGLCYRNCLNSEKGWPMRIKAFCLLIIKNSWKTVTISPTSLGG